MPWKSLKQLSISLRPVAARNTRMPASTAAVPAVVELEAAEIARQHSASFSTSIVLMGVVKSWAFINCRAYLAMASLIFGWQWPSVVT